MAIIYVPEHVLRGIEIVRKNIIANFQHVWDYVGKINVREHINFTNVILDMLKIVLWQMWNCVKPLPKL
jgi:hypothetical protein